VASFHLRFVGATELPKSLSEFDVDQSFRLGVEDIEVVRTRFRTDQRLGAALQLVFVRAAGRSLEKLAGVPRTLLKSLCSALGLNETAIASLKTLYQRRSTLYEHRKWAVEASGLSPADDSVLTQLQAALGEIATIAASVDDLVKEAGLWLFDRKHLLPGDRVLRDASRTAFASIEAAAIGVVRAQVEAPRIADYDALFDPIRQTRQARSGRQPGDPALAAKAMLALVDQEDPPPHLLLGSDALGLVRGKLRELKDMIDAWEPLTRSTDAPVG